MYKKKELKTSCGVSLVLNKSANANNKRCFKSNSVKVTSMSPAEVKTGLLASEHLAFGPNGCHDHGVAERDDKSRNDEQGSGHERHVQLPLPRLREVDPALQLTWDTKIGSSGCRVYMGGKQMPCNEKL